MQSAAEYRQYAAECLAVAERVSSPNDKATLIAMAQAFLDLANKQERGELPSGD
jgi:hypothetical protein